MSKTVLAADFVKILSACGRDVSVVGKRQIAYLSTFFFRAQVGCPLYAVSGTRLCCRGLCNLCFVVLISDYGSAVRARDIFSGPHYFIGDRAWVV